MTGWIVVVNDAKDEHWAAPSTLTPAVADLPLNDAVSCAVPTFFAVTTFSAIVATVSSLEVHTMPGSALASLPSA